MLAIIHQALDGSYVKFYGPFTSERAAENYAVEHGMGLYIVVKLHDSGEAMDY